MIIVDDLRPDLRSFGHTDAPPTPHIDAFAARARVFRRAYAQFPDCAPSRNSFLTGLRPDHLGMNSHDCVHPHPLSGMKCHIRETALGTKVQSLPQHFKEQHGYLALSYGKVFHQGLDDDESWSPQAEFPDGYPRGRSNDSSWKTRKWFYEQWLDPANANCSATHHATGGCMTEEHYGKAPLHSYVDHRTASAAVNSLWRLGGHRKGAPVGTEGFAFDPAKGLAGGDWLVPGDNLHRPWFMAVGFVRPHLPFVCPKRFWDQVDDPYLTHPPRSSEENGENQNGGSYRGRKQKRQPLGKHQRKLAAAGGGLGEDGEEEEEEEEGGGFASEHQQEGFLPRQVPGAEGPSRVRITGNFSELSLDGSPWRLPRKESRRALGGSQVKTSRNGLGLGWAADFFPNEPRAQFGFGASNGLVAMQGSSDTGFGEFRDFIPWDLRTVELFSEPKAAMKVPSWRGGGEVPVASLRSDSRRAYRACVAFVDYEVGRVLDALDETKQASETVAVVLSDHGWKLGEFGLWGKHSVLHSDVHVPLLLFHPQMQHPGLHSHAVVELVDLFPTLVDLAAPAAPSSASGSSSSSSSSLNDRDDETATAEAPADAATAATPMAATTRRLEVDGQSLAHIVLGHPQATARQQEHSGHRRKVRSQAGHQVGGSGGDAEGAQFAVKSSFGEVLPSGGKNVAIAQYMPYTSRHHRKCMAYTVIGAMYAMKRWAPSDLMGRCPHEHSQDLHLVYGPVYPVAPGQEEDGDDDEGGGAVDAAAGRGGGGGTHPGLADDDTGASRAIGFLVEAGPNLAPSFQAFQLALEASEKFAQQSGQASSFSSSSEPAQASLLATPILPKAHRAPAVRRAMQAVLAWAQVDAKLARQRRKGGDKGGGAGEGSGRRGDEAPGARQINQTKEQKGRHLHEKEKKRKSILGRARRDRIQISRDRRSEA